VQRPARGDARRDRRPRGGEVSGYPVDWSKYPATAARVDEVKLSAEAEQYLASQSGESSGNSQARTEEGEE
jgi:hypothetical protein